MAQLEDLIQHIPDPQLRQQIAAAVSDLKRRQNFGLKYEDHIPEITALAGLKVEVGVQVLRRDDPGSATLYTVEALTPDGQAVLTPSGGAEAVTVPASSLLVVKRFGEPIYPALTSLGTVQRGPEDKPSHAVINAENYHALQLLLYLYEGQVDCLYLDPPYNTGARDWKYNNRYVDSNDVWRHSKWLSYMEKRLALAKRLLKPDGVLIITIDEHEVHHLGMLLERVFSDAYRQMVTICINPSGVSGGGLSRVEEYAFFCFLGGAGANTTSDDMLTEMAETSDRRIRWESLMRGGNAWYRSARRNLCYPIVLDKAGKKIVDVGEPFAGKDEERPSHIDGNPIAWPVRLDGHLGIWRVEASRLRELARQGYAYVSSSDPERGTWTIRYLMSGTVDDIDAGLIEITGTGENGEATLLPKTSSRTIAKTMWKRGRHTAGGGGGTHMLVTLLGERDLFPFPKSLYAVTDCLSVAVRERPDALVVDCWAGSGTTFHATCLLNAEDNGRRRCVLVTNNEVREDDAKTLNKAGLYFGDLAFEEHGIFEEVTRPRCEAVVTGMRPNGDPIPGKHNTGRNYAEGFPENVEFFKLDYLDPDNVSLGQEFAAILPALWLTAGGIRTRELPPDGADFTLPNGCPYGVLFKESRFRQFQKALAERSDITHVWLVTDSDEAFAEMRAQLPTHLTIAMLYRDYLRNFQINTDRSL
jgi:adenine-specific DNA-methyltransferase